MVPCWLMEAREAMTEHWELEEVRWTDGAVERVEGGSGRVERWGREG